MLPWDLANGFFFAFISCILSEQIDQDQKNIEFELNTTTVNIVKEENSSVGVIGLNIKSTNLIEIAHRPLYMAGVANMIMFHIANAKFISWLHFCPSSSNYTSSLDPMVKSIEYYGVIQVGDDIWLYGGRTGDSDSRAYPAKQSA